MSFLLDTCALIWALTDPDRLGPRAAEVIRDPSCELTVSAATAWEISTKVRLGKLPAASALVIGYAGHLERLGATELAITGREALLSGSMQWDHRDPFDRMIAAHGLLDNIALLTSDAAFSALPGLTVIW